MASDVLASLLSAYTYYKNKNIDIRRGLIVMLTAFIGTIIGSYCGYLFSQKQPDGLGYISMLTTVFLGVKFLIKPVSGGKGAVLTTGTSEAKNRTILAMCLGGLIGWVCGFTGSGGGILMLAVFTVVLGYNLKIAVGTSTLIMSIVALTGTISHFRMGAELKILPMLIVILSCLVGAVIAAEFANKCEIKKLNRIVGSVLIVLGITTILIKLV